LSVKHFKVIFYAIYILQFLTVSFSTCYKIVVTQLCPIKNIHLHGFPNLVAFSLRIFFNQIVLTVSFDLNINNPGGLFVSAFFSLRYP
jgi:hypothetical protein